MQRVGRKRLLQEFDAGIQLALMHDRVVGVAGHVQHLQLGTLRRRAARTAAGRSSRA